MADVHGNAALEGLSDEKLVELARDGDEDAFAALVSHSADIIQQQSLHYRGIWQDAEDLSQEGLLALLSAVRTYRADGTASFRTYASVCIRHRMLTAAKRAYSLRDVPQPIWEDAEDGQEMPAALINGQADPAQLVMRREDTARLRSRLREELTDLEFQVLMLYLGAYTYDEIAQRLGIGFKTVDNALQRVRRKLVNGSFCEN